MHINAPGKSWNMHINAPGKSWNMHINAPGKSWNMHINAPGKSWKTSFSVLYASWHKVVGLHYITSDVWMVWSVHHWLCVQYWVFNCAFEMHLLKCILVRTWIGAQKWHLHIQGDHFPDHMKFPDFSSRGKQRLPGIECLPIRSTVVISY